MKLNPLTPAEERIILHKGTESPFTNEYDQFFAEGIYQCRQCNTPLYRSNNKFHSDCGWPSFDQEIKGKVKRVPDADGHRVEIQCATCGGHLGHVFEGEQYTEKNTRHCVNSLSIKFIPKEKLGLKTIVLGGGCFWCSEAVFLLFPGVFSVTSGYAGGSTSKPTYEKVCAGKTGHAEVIQVEYDPKEMPLEELLNVFFAMHDPTTLNRQGADVGTQYRSIVLYTTDDQKKIIEKKMIQTQKEFANPIVTEVKKLEQFYPAEKHHQNYYEQNVEQTYCQVMISPKLKKIREKFKV